MIKIFNLFITYGDTFLPNPTTYDELYYELIRVHKVFDDLYTIGKIFYNIMSLDYECGYVQYTSNFELQPSFNLSLAV